MSRTPVGIQLAALYARDDDFAFLQRTIDAIAVAADNKDPFQTLDIRFHIGIACAIGNITVLRLAKLLTGTLWAARKLLPTYGLETPDFTLDIHTTTLAALMSRNPANVAAVMDEDLAQLKHAWQCENQRTVGCALARLAWAALIRSFSDCCGVLGELECGQVRGIHSRRLPARRPSERLQTAAGTAAASYATTR
jgi:hypothetical protein